MAENGGGEVDIGQLSGEERSALDQYTAVTAQDIKEAVPLLQRSQWNVQIAITKFFDGEGSDPLAEAMAAEDHVPQQASRHENLQESLLTSGAGMRPLPRNRPDPAPRIVPQPSTTHRPPLLLAILFAPFNFGYRAISTIFRAFTYVLAFLPASIRPRAITTTMTSGFRGTAGRRMLMPRDTAARFKREFDEEYGPNNLSWFEGGFAQALDAAKKDIKFLLMVIMSPEHDDTEFFTRNTLLAPQVVEFINDPANNIVLWGGNVLDSEAYQVAAEYNCTKYPFSCLVCLTPKEGSTRMSIVKRLVGNVSPSTYVAEIQTAINKYAPDLSGVRAERSANEVARNLRSEQDSAYERSLARDRERARQRKEAEAASRDEEKRALEAAEAAERLEQQRQQWRFWRATTISAEPDTSVPAKDVVRLALKLPEEVGGGGRVVRRFAASATVEELYAFVECYDLLHGGELDPEKERNDALSPEAPEDYKHHYRFRIASPMPRAVYAPDETATLAETIGRSGNLIVENAIEEEDDTNDS